MRKMLKKYLTAEIVYAILNKLFRTKNIQKTVSIKKLLTKATRYDNLDKLFKQQTTTKYKL